MGIWHDLRWVWMTHVLLIGPSKVFSKSVEDVTNAKRWNLKLANQHWHPLVGLNPLLHINTEIWDISWGWVAPKRNGKMEPTNTYENRELLILLVLNIPGCWLGTWPWFCFTIHGEHVRAWTLRGCTAPQKAYWKMFSKLAPQCSLMLCLGCPIFFWPRCFGIWYSHLSQVCSGFYCLLSGT